MSQAMENYWMLLSGYMKALLQPLAAMSASERLWMGLGLFAQALFAGRFIVQWIASERAKRSVVPLSFWFFSVLGGVLLFVYAIKRRDIVFILGQGAGLVVYVRNLYLIYRERMGDRGGKPAMAVEAEHR